MDQSPRSSRRALLYGIGMGGVGFATASWAQRLATPLATVLPRVQTVVRQASLEGWAAAVGTNFVVQNGRLSSTMTLISAKALDAGGTRPAGTRPIPFSLVFEGSQGSLVPAGNQSYFFKRSDGTMVELFVSAKIPVGTKAQLVAVLN
jgi:hypothetical protein